MELVRSPRRCLSRRAAAVHQLSRSRHDWHGHLLYRTSGHSAMRVVTAAGVWLRSVSLTSGKTQLLDPLGEQVCGERILVGADHLVVLLQDQPLAVLFVDGRTGTVRRHVTTPAAPIDALLLPG